MLNIDSQKLSLIDFLRQKQIMLANNVFFFIIILNILRSCTFNSTFHVEEFRMLIYLTFSQNYKQYIDHRSCSKEKAE